MISSSIRRFTNQIPYAFAARIVDDEGDVASFFQMESDFDRRMRASVRVMIEDGGGESCSERIGRAGEQAGREKGDSVAFISAHGIDAFGGKRGCVEAP